MAGQAGEQGLHTLWGSKPEGARTNRVSLPTRILISAGWHDWVYQANAARLFRTSLFQPTHSTSAHLLGHPSNSIRQPPSRTSPDQSSQKELSTWLSPVPRCELEPPFSFRSDAATREGKRDKRAHPALRRVENTVIWNGCEDSTTQEMGRGELISIRCGPCGLFCAMAPNPTKNMFR